MTQVTEKSEDIHAAEKCVASPPDRRSLMAMNLNCGEKKKGTLESDF